MHLTAVVDERIWGSCSRGGTVRRSTTATAWMPATKLVGLLDQIPQFVIVSSPGAPRPLGQHTDHRRARSPGT